MGQATVRARVRELSAKEVYRRLADFPEYPRLCDAVREVVVLEADEQHMVSAWEVNFHRGILRWTERAEFCPDEGLIRFAEVEATWTSSAATGRFKRMKLSQPLRSSSIAYGSALTRRKGPC